MIHVSLSQVLPSAPPAVEPVVARHAAKPTDYDRARESQAHNAASQGIHVPLIEGEGDHSFLNGRHHYPEAAAQIDQAVGAFSTGRVA